MRIRKLKLPHEYQQVEYITLPSAGYIDTLYIPDYINGFRVEFEFSLPTLGKRYGLLSNYNTGSAQLSLEIAANNKIRFWANSGGLDSNNANCPIKSSDIDSCTLGRNHAIFEYINSQCYMECNGSSTSGTYNATIGTPSSTCYLGLDRAKRTGTFTEPISFYSCIILSQNKEIMNLIPCYRKNDNKIGMFDIIKQQFLPVQGTGTFGQGNNNTVIENYSIKENCFIPSYLQQLDYIASSGSQYINLDYICKTNNLNIELDMAWTGSSTGAFETFIGFMQSTSQTVPRIGLHKYSSALMFGADATTTSGISLTANERFIYKGDFTSGAQKLYKNGSQIANNTTSYNFTSNTCPLYLFARYCPNSMNYATMRLYSCIIKEGTSIVKQLIPCYNIMTEEIGLYDLISKNFYTNAGTGKFIKGNVIFNNNISLISFSPVLPETALLPKLYQRVQYIQSSGTQYINTTKPVHMNWKYEIDFQQNTSGTFRTWGAFNQQSYVGPNCSLTYVSNQFAIRWESRAANNQESRSFGMAVNTDRHKLIIDKGVPIFDGTGFTKTAGHSDSFVTSYPAFLFTINPGGTAPTTNLNGKIYSYKVWDENNILQQWFVPCYKKSDNMVGMFDIIEKKFYNNNGTGNFIKGGNI